MHDKERVNPTAAAVRRELQQLVAAHGADVLDDARRVRAMIADAVPGSDAEANLIGLALSSGVPRRLRDAGYDPGAASAAAAQAVDSLERTSSVQRDDADWAVSALAAAIGSPAANTAPSNQPSPAPSPMPSPGVPPGARPSAGLRIQVAGREFTVAAGQGATIGRDPECTITLDSPAVSRRHARIEPEGSGWAFIDDGSTQGSFMGGSAVRRQTLTQPGVITLGQGNDAVQMSVTPPGVVGADPTRLPGAAAGQRPMPAPATELPGGQRPGGAYGAVPAARTELGGTPSPTLTATLGGVTKSIGLGQSLTIGRESDNDLVSQASTASRHHARIIHDGRSWVLTDNGSTSGTWQGTQRVSTQPLAGEQSFVIGDPQRGDTLRINAPGTAPRGSVPTGAGASKGAASKRGLLVAGVAALALAVVGGGLYWGLTQRDDEPEATSTKTTGDKTSGLTPDQLAQGTVLIEVSCKGGSNPGWIGSGTIIDKEKGLVLTNAHVVDPGAPGQAVGQWMFSDDPDAQCKAEPYKVSVATGLDHAAEPMFIASLVASDGYLDAAIIKLDKRLSGAPVEASDLDALTQIPLGDSDTVKSSDQVDFIGYPLAAGSSAPTFTQGVISGPVQDDRIGILRSQINTTAIISGGNSGGLAADDAGDLIGIPTWSKLDNEENPVYSTIRPINLVKPLIDAARAEKKYTSPYAVAGASSAQIKPWSYSTSATTAGEVSAGCELVYDRPDPQSLAIGFPYEGFGAGPNTDVLAALFDPATGKPVAISVTTYPTKLPPKGCMTVAFSRPVPNGEYTIKIGVGGDHRLIADGPITIN